MKYNEETDALFAYPMHGQTKLSNEGYRTRDGHLIEWFGRLHSPGVCVFSRPEPAVFNLIQPGTSRINPATIAFNTYPVRSVSYRLPRIRDRRRWWDTSKNSYPIRTTAASGGAVIWNPFLSLTKTRRNPYVYSDVTVFDLLDDWSVHFHFTNMRSEVERAYRVAFDSATYVTANSEGTLALAHRFGRSDAMLMPNGVDPSRFSSRSRASGAITLGYVGKIGKRIDLTLVESVCAALPEMKFVFAGPILDQEYKPRLAAIPNLELVGDVHYTDVPALLERFDIGWVPHRVGEGEVGGDVIKTYEYRAAGLPVLATPLNGLGNQGLDEVSIIPWQGHTDWLRDITRSQVRVSRLPTVLPSALTWESKARRILSLLSKG